MPHQTHKWKVIMTAIHSTLHKSYGGAKSCELNAMKMTVMGRDANLTTRLIREGGVHIPKEDITLPFWKEAHAHIHAHTHIQNYQQQKQTLKTPPPVHLSVHGQMTKLTNIYFIELRMNFCHKLFKNRKHACFCLKCATVNRMFPLSEQHTKPCIKKRCLGHKFINSRIK